MLRSISGLTAVLAAAGALVAPTLAGPTANAAVPGLVRVTATSPSNSVGKAVTVACPAGKRVIGVGGFTSGPPGEVVLDDLTPNAGLNSASVSAYETDGTAVSWTVTAVAECSAPLPGLTRVFSNSGLNSVDKSATATCPAGTNVIGSGSQIDIGLGDVITDRLAPNVGLTSVTVTAREDAALTRNWDVIAYAICANPLPGLQRVAGSPPANSVNKIAVARCPVGTVAISTGAGFAGANGEALLGQVNPGGGSVVATGDEEDPIAGNWTVEAVAVCATP